MTWGELKAQLEAAGVTDEAEVFFEMSYDKSAVGRWELSVYSDGPAEVVLS